MRRQQFSTDTDWESAVGYSRATRAGSIVHVSGTTATAEDGTPIDGGPYEQTIRCLEIIESSLSAVDASIEDVTRTRLFVTDIDDWEPIGTAHAEVFGSVRPATTMVEVDRLIDPALCVEIEADAVCE